MRARPVPARREWEGATSTASLGTGSSLRIGALAALDKEPFDLVLMDIQMPVMSGEVALAAVRERERGMNTHLPVIALTAYALKGDEERYLAEGFDDYVSKPLEVKKLAAEMQRVLKLKDTADSVIE